LPVTFPRASSAGKWGESRNFWKNATGKTSRDKPLKKNLKNLQNVLLFSETLLEEVVPVVKPVIC
jgi:hypothetical protein